MKKLHVVTIYYRTVVYAETSAEAEREAIAQAGEDAYTIHNAAQHCDAIVSGGDIPRDWCGCIPWGDSRERTCEQILRDAATCDAVEEW